MISPRRDRFPSAMAGILTRNVVARYDLGAPLMGNVWSTDGREMRRECAPYAKV